MGAKFEKQPIVFYFQPEEYEVLEIPEKIMEWEKNMKEEVGLDVVIADLTGTATSCTCHGGLLDDCDYDHH
jgi:hypothetical protein